ncbi:calcium/sodium antiporter [Acidihalobacter prosperus]
MGPLKVFLAVITIITGLALLIWSADRFIFGASVLARILGVTPLVIGLTIVGMGTSAPELLVSALAAWNGNPSLGIGNAIGSNITNIGLILGVATLVTPLTLSSGLLKRELPLLFISTLLGYALIADGYLARIEGGILLLGLAALLSWIVWTARHTSREGPIGESLSPEIPTHSSGFMAITWLAAGLLLMLLGAQLLIWGSVKVAHLLGVSDLVIGLTIVAIGTSLPELATTLLGLWRKEPDIVIGNIIGSNLFNTLGVLALPGLIAPGPIPRPALERDYPLMLLMTLLLLLFSYGKQPKRITRLEGGLLFGVFIGYECWLYWTI